MNSLRFSYFMTNLKIKFRGMGKVGKQMIVGDLARLMNEDNLCIMPDSFYGTRDFGGEYNNGDAKIEDYLAIGGFYPVIKETVGQFTGLKDKNGKDIYEGDILQIESDKLMVVGWSEKFASFILTHEDWVFSHWFGESCNPESCEIKGNIYENPELLNP